MRARDRNAALVEMVGGRTHRLSDMCLLRDLCTRGGTFVGGETSGAPPP